MKHYWTLTWCAVLMLSLLAVGFAAPTTMGKPVWLAHAKLAPTDVANTQSTSHAMRSLGQVPNFKQFSKAIPIGLPQKQLLMRNLFVCSPTDAKQMFHIYEQNDYLNLPNFVTSDSVLQLYHIFYDYSLRTVESESLTPVLKRLTAGMLADSLKVYQGADDAKLKEAALHNLAYFGVADRALGGKAGLPAEALTLVRAELTLMDLHKGFGQGSIFPYHLDYSQFVPRGHYTRTETLRHFFRAMMWYGLAPFALTYESAAGGTVRADIPIIQGLLLVNSLNRSELASDWETIYEPTSFFVGFADDLTPAQWRTASDEVYGKDAVPSAFADASKLDAFVAAARKLRPARIQPRLGRTSGVPAGTPNMIEPPLAESDTQLRFMGQRYIPDSEVLQRLSVPLQRVFPSGLDIMAVLGSKRAQSILDASPRIYNAGGWAGYVPERNKLLTQFQAMNPETWSSNLYWSWLDVLRTLLQPAPGGSPAFMRNAAWQDKSLHAALGSWAELRHDTILYGKQSVTECGGDGEEKPFVKGYVEPNLAFFDRLLQLTKQSRDGLVTRKLITDPLKDKFEQFIDMLTFLRRIAAKELSGQKPTQEEYLQIRYIGGDMEHMTLSVMQGEPQNWENVTETDKNMAVVADVHTGGSQVLEEAVGPANEILVVVPVEGKLSLARGATFSYYEFKHPISDRLTDEKWQALLHSGQAPAPPGWTRSFVAGGSHAINKEQLEAYSSGC